PEGPEPALVRAHTRPDLKPQSGVRRQQGEYAVRGRAGPQLAAAACGAIGECGQQPRVELAEGAVRLAVVGGCPAHLRRQRLLAPALEPVGVLLVDRRPNLAQEPHVALAGLTLHCLDLV